MMNMRSRILLVENDDIYRQTIKEFFEHSGYQVFSESSELSARQVISQVRPDLAVIDIRLKDDTDENDFSGLRLARDIGSVPKILLTPNSGYSQSIFEQSVDGSLPPLTYVSKTEGADQLLRFVVDLLGHFAKSSAIDSLKMEVDAVGKNTSSPRRLSVFLCHAHNDKALVRPLYNRLVKDGYETWFDEKSLLPGQDWDSEIRKAVKKSDVIIVCLSVQSVNKEGYVRKEIRFALDVAEEKLESTIYIIPARLEECEIPEPLSRWQWVSLFKRDGYSRLKKALEQSAQKFK